MRIKVLEQTLEFGNTPSVIEELMHRVAEILEEANYFFSHMVIDGVEVYEDVDIYIADNLKDIEFIEIKAHTVQEFVQQILLSAQDYLQRALPALHQLIDDLYAGAKGETWESFGQLLEAMQWLTEMIQSIDRSSYKPENWDAYLLTIGNIQQVLVQIEEALRAEDTVLLADLLNYELLPLLEELQQAIRVTAENEGLVYDSH